MDTLDTYCSILITHAEGKLIGEFLPPMGHCTFDPTTVLADLRYTPNIRPFEGTDSNHEMLRPLSHITLNGSIDKEINSFLEEYERHFSEFNPTAYVKEKEKKYTLIPFDDFDYNCEWAFGERIDLKDNEREAYYKLGAAIRMIILDSYYEKQDVDLSKVEIMRSFFDISCRFTPSLLYERKEIPVHSSHLSLDYVNGYNPEEFSSFFYECDSLSDVVFSILHFLALNHFKFNRCAHCGNYFATTSYKQKYCSRHSFYPGFEHLCCEQAVRNILQKLRRTRAAIGKNLELNYHTAYVPFSRTSGELLDAVIKNPTYENINAAFDYINKERHYTRSRHKTRPRQQ